MKCLLMLLCLALSSLWAACGTGEPTRPTPPQTQPTLVVVLPAVTPSVLSAQLTPASTLEAAAQQLATALGIVPDNVRVRIKANCSVCEAEKLQKATSLDGVSVAEAKKLLAANYDFWFFVRNLTCAYHYDGKMYLPQGCQLAAL